MSEKILIVVQARTSSSRLPGKVLLPILGETLLFRMIERLKMVKRPNQIVIATSDQPGDDEIQKLAESIDIPCFRGSLNNLLDRHYQAGKAFNADLVLKIPSDCPLIDPVIVDEVLDYYFEHEGAFDFVGNLHPATFPDGNDVEIMTMECLEKAWNEASKPLELEHTTPYIWENPDKFRLGNVAWNTGLDYSMSHRFTIDYPEDYEFICRVFEELYPEKKDFSCDDILTLLNRKPEIYQINAGYAGVNWYRNHLDELKTISVSQTKII
ncbi:spore coat polysaccharide biosynthesis protein SpsF [Pseudarcicella hirudinis]|uniref:Spore coat polysaccharide biosynthesis protein SpsF n=1 Tax=Pseudarcicella hirudinis TaxID=1079859 RepID=A0A1I5YZU7_9BACT|nr:glycosyltransferase family protein [Pseudarcicella hirudinis]SFQ49783.1 spore coat polysaccharide biosynthesis protein SpsF [Pseudarcicella hirudinis]